MPARRDVTVFLVLVFLLPWPVWVVEQLTGSQVLFFVAMICVAISTWVAVRYVWRPGNIRQATAIGPVRWKLCLLAAGLFILMEVVAIALNAATGVFPVDLTDFSALREAYGPDGSVGALALRALGFSLVQLVLILPLAFCEEWGWRGYLLTRLSSRLGPWPAMVLIGAVAGVWHLPFYLGPWFSMGADERQSFVPFVIYCVFFGVLLGLLRFAGGSIWPAVAAHAVNNTIVFGFLDLVAADADAQRNAWTTGLSGWQGLLVMLVAIVALASTPAVRRGMRVPDRTAVGASAPGAATAPGD
ncbi:CPBP family intramembrane metalloprotease [Actinoplanes sp. LDG1-06]|uniref:CPBP family intramembrane metalloprotease n=1 Tax=Paractinoplanes ovalisporus TaxID=2810368 RepID=A0ABS2A8A4_9ACTN|nr:type II CAAX endopeptidase family protein [Actinoplanes ovalisporus]MBM2616065.1 CPBP family intramembrane metalloprotease [Actinoplanes ovalisporus]